LVALGSHPNVVPVLGVIDTGKVLVMEKAETELSSAIKATNGALPLRRMRRWMQDILRGVDFIHRHGVIHKDMKSSNILISRSGTLQICDFGLLHGQGRR
ncbi:kinase-like domain-containing protein, partial [Baffinella frigidus]